MERDYYQETLARLEPDISMVDGATFYASAAISLKRLADAVELHNGLMQQVVDKLEAIEMTISQK